MNYIISIVDDEKVAREVLSLALGKIYSVKSFATAESAIKNMADHPPDLVLLDIGLPGMSGVEALKEIKSRYPEIMVIMITAYEDVKTVVSAMKFGAYDYVVKPLQMEALKVILRNAFETIEAIEEEQFDIIISDFRLPGMNGLDFIKQTAVIQPDAIRFLITAYRDDYIFSDNALDGINEFIEKPFAVKTLVNLLALTLKRQ